MSGLEIKRCLVFVLISCLPAASWRIRRIYNGTWVVCGRSLNADKPRCTIGSPYLTQVSVSLHFAQVSVLPHFTQGCLSRRIAHKCLSRRISHKCRSCRIAHKCLSCRTSHKAVYPAALHTSVCLSPHLTQGCLSFVSVCLWVCEGVWWWQQAQRMNLKQAVACEKQVDPEYQSALDAYDQVPTPSTSVSLPRDHHLACELPHITCRIASRVSCAGVATAVCVHTP